MNMHEGTDRKVVVGGVARRLYDGVIAEDGCVWCGEDVEIFTDEAQDLLHHWRARVGDPAECTACFEPYVVALNDNDEVWLAPERDEEEA